MQNMGPQPTPAPGIPPGGQPGQTPLGPAPQGMPPPAPVVPPPAPVTPPSISVVDVAGNLPHGIQLCDFAVRYLKKAAASIEFNREPVVGRAAVLAVIDDIEKIIAAMSEKGGKGMAAENPMAPGGDEDEGSGDAPEPEETSDSEE